MEGKKLLGLNKYAWMGVAALGVVVFLYFRHQANTAQAATANAPAPDASATDTAALGGTPPSNDPASTYAADNGSLVGDLMSLLLQSQQQYGDNLAVLAGSGVHASGGGTAPVGTTAGGQPVYANPATGGNFVITDTGYAQPAYVGPSGALVSPTTYAGIGATPQPINGANVVEGTIHPSALPLATSGGITPISGAELNRMFATAGGGSPKAKPITSRMVAA